MAKLSNYMKFHPKQKEAMKHLGHGERVFFGGARGGGKALSLDSIVYTPYGPRRNGDLKVGDIISNPDGSPQRVIQVHDFKDIDMYKIKFEDGAETICNLDHLWLIRKTASHKSKTASRAEETNDFQRGDIMDTRMIIEWIDNKENKQESKASTQFLCVPLCNPIKFTKPYKVNMRVIEPYVLGLLIGDGCLTYESPFSVRFSGIDKEMRDKVAEYGYEMTTYKDGKNHSITGKGIGEEIRKLGLNGKKSIDKFIPDPYKYGTVEQRIELVQGLMDTDGYVDDRGHMSYTSISEQLAKDFQWVIRSLGGKATITKGKAGYKDKDGVYIQCNDAYTVYFNTKINPELVFLPRKKERCKYEFNGGMSELQRRIIGYEYVGKQDARCITVSHPNQLYVIDDFVVTHNSYLALMAAIYFAIKFAKLNVVIIRQTYQELEDNFIQLLLEDFPPEKFGYIYHSKTKTAKFSNQSKIKFRALDTESDLKKIKGVAYQFMIIDEANEYMIKKLQMIWGSVRNASRVKNWISSVLMTGNPGGISDEWFKSHYIFPDYKKWTMQELEYKDKMIYIQSKVHDNPSMEKEYIDNLKSLEDDLRKAWLDGDWNTFNGQFFSKWNPSIHVIAPFDIPPDWIRVAGIDEGGDSHPTVCLLMAQDPKTGVVYLYREYYGNKTSVQEDIANIKLLTQDEQIDMWIADTSLWNAGIRKDDFSLTSAQMYHNEGIPIIPANKDRVLGWRIMKEWIHYTNTHKPQFYSFETCVQFNETLPTNRYEKSKLLKKVEDMDTKGQDDGADCARYIFKTGFGSPQYRGITLEEIENPEILGRPIVEQERNSIGIPKENVNLDHYEEYCYSSLNSWYL